MKIKAFLTTLFLTGTTAVSTAHAQDIAFQAGENLTYTASYKVGFIEPDIAKITFKTINSKVDGLPTYRITAVAEVDSKWRWFFDMRDEYNTWLDTQTLRPVYFTNSIREGSYRTVSRYFYDWDAMVVNTHFTNLKYNVPRERFVSLTANSFDGIALFFNMRNKISPEMCPGHADYVDLVMTDTIKRLRYTFIGFEERNISGLGKYRTMKFSCQLTTPDDYDSFPDGTEFYVWFSDDRNRIPLYLETPIRVGSVKCYLSSYQGLKYPLGGKVK